ncbi:sulfite exporter TauE/SafE family protein [Corynebacterium falsenii]|uniref:sulfite exporter TauE/SafE family protein n=1 Tax=Corynebacterium falsenii TaxID=108486 RepID=UPI003FD214FF
MTILHILALGVLAVIIGLAVGILGGGGAILAVPVFTFVAGFPASQAVGASFVVVGASSLFGVLLRLRSGSIRWIVGLTMAAAGALGAQAGQWLGSFVSDRVTLIVFALVMLLSAVSMLRGSRPSRSSRRPSIPLVLALGIGIGVLTGFTGAGGGFIIVPALVALSGLPFAAASATSLLVITINSASGLLGYLGEQSLPWATVGSVVAIALVGTFIGTWIASRVDGAKLKVAFGAVTLVIGLGVLMSQLVGGG